MDWHYENLVIPFLLIIANGIFFSLFHKCKKRTLSIGVAVMVVVLMGYLAFIALTQYPSRPREGHFDMLAYNNSAYSGVYSGYWLNGKPHGSGTLYLDNGDMYIGDWKDGLLHGQGTFVHMTPENIIRTYVGDFFYNYAEGYGTLIWENGDVYIGEFVNNLRHGKVRRIHADGTIENERTWYEGKELNPE